MSTLAPPQPRSADRRAPWALAATLAAAGLGWFLASLKLKGIVAVTGALVLIAVLTLARRRELLILAGVAGCLALMLHKTVGGIAAGVNSGPPSIYLTTLDALLVVLYAMWAHAGTLRADLTRAFRERPILWLPLVPLVTLLPSLLAAPKLNLALAEVVRTVWMYALFVYLAIRVRSFDQIRVILGTFGGIALLELAVVALQWKTHGTFAASLLGTPAQLGTRVFDDGTAGRPFGTLQHPAFLGALLGCIALLALAFGLGLTRRRDRLVCLAFVPLAALPLLISNVRASLLGLGAGAALIVLVMLARRRVKPVVLVAAVALASVAALAAWPLVSQQLSHSFGSQHYSLEVQARTELNDLALKMIADRPVLGVGLNNFQVAMVPYEKYPLVFPDNAVHNIFLLVIAETGFLGFAGMLALWFGLVVVAVRLVRRQADRFVAALGTGVLAVYLFFSVEELLSYSLREDAPLAMFWILAGLSVAAGRMGRNVAAQRKHAGSEAQAPLPAAAGAR